jgi:hypothetical protein
MGHDEESPYDICGDNNELIDISQIINIFFFIFYQSIGIFIIASIKSESV